MRFAYAVSHDGEPVEIAMYDVAGRQIRTLVAEAATAGRHETSWDGRDNHGGHAMQGVYFLRAAIGADRRVVRVVYLDRDRASFTCRRREAADRSSPGLAARMQEHTARMPRLWRGAAATRHTEIQNMHRDTTPRFPASLTRIGAMLALALRLDRDANARERC